MIICSCGMETERRRVYKKYITDNMTIVNWYEDAGVRKRLDSLINYLDEAGISIKKLKFSYEILGQLKTIIKGDSDIFQIPEDFTTLA